MPGLASNQANNATCTIMILLSFKSNKCTTQVFWLIVNF
jgi:hypothetical protein